MATSLKPEPLSDEMHELSICHHHVKSKEMNPLSLSWDELVTRLKSYQVGPKDGPYLLRGPCNGERGNDNVPFAEFLIIDGDRMIDLETGEIIRDTCVHPSVAHEALQDLGIRHVIHTSHSHRKDGPNKWRAWIPCRMENSSELSAMAGWIIDQLNERGCMAALVTEMTTWAQPWYLPRIHSKDAEFLFLYGWDGDPISREQVAEILGERKAVGQNIKVDSEPTRTTLGPSTPIGWYLSNFGDAANIVALLEQDGCDLRGTDFVNGKPAYRLLPPESETGAPGVHVFQGKDDDRCLVYSHNGSYSLEPKILDAFGIYTKVEHRGDLNSAIEAVRDMMSNGAIDWMSGDDFGGDELQADEFTIDGFIANGTLTISAPPGAGKTTNLTPLAAMVAHICANDDRLKPTLRRNVIYMAEATGQVKNAIYTIRKHQAPDITPDDVRQRFRIVPSKRMSLDDLRRYVSRHYQRECYVANINSQWGDVIEFKLEPLFVFDTTSACFDIENENDNSEVSSFIAAVREASSPTCPVWFVCHEAKNISTTEARSRTARGASAWGGDVHGTAFLVAEGDSRYLITGKRRFDPEFTELRMIGNRHEYKVRTPYGTVQNLRCFSISMERSDTNERKKQEELGREFENCAERETVKEQILKFVTECHNAGQFVTKNMVRDSSSITSGRNTIPKIIPEMVADRMIETYPITQEIRKSRGVNSRISECLRPIGAGLPPESVRPLNDDRERANGLGEGERANARLVGGVLEVACGNE